MLAAAFLALFVCGLSAGGQTVTWQALPFPTTSDWPGPFGQPATISANSVTLEGQPARTVESFTAPFTITCDVQLASRFTDDGAFTLYLLAPGQPTDTDPTTGLALQIVYSNTGAFGSVDRILVAQLSNGQTLWSDATFSVAGGITYHLTLQVSGAGGLNLDIDGTPYTIPSEIAFACTDAQIQIAGWQPDNTWTVSNFAVVPEPSAASLLGLSLVGVLALLRFRRLIRWDQHARSEEPVRR